MTKVLYLFIFVSAFYLGACGKLPEYALIPGATNAASNGLSLNTTGGAPAGTSTGGSPTGNTGTTGSTSGSGTSGSPGQPQALFGLWRTPCYADPSGAYQFQVTYNFQPGGGLQTSIEYFGADVANCQKPEKRDTYVGTYTTSVSILVSNTWNINTVTTFTAMTILDQAYLNQANSQSLCGVTWTLGQAVEIAKTGCASEAVPRNYFQLASVIPDGTKLYFGQTDTTHTGATADARPVTLSTVNYFNKTSL